LAVNLLAWTYVKTVYMPDGSDRMATQNIVPMVTWPSQDRLILKLIDCIKERKPIQIWKSRDMGVTWITLMVFWWFFMFDANKDFLVFSRAEELVDNPGDPDCLFWKLRFLMSHERMPDWIIPAGFLDDKNSNRHLHLQNPRTNCTIDGRATTSRGGVGGRRDAVMVDEAASVPNLKSLWEALTDTARCRIAVSTPLGGSYFNKLYFNSGLERVRMMWWDHPGKVDGLRWNKTEHGGWELTSNWDQIQRATRSPEDYAENVAADPKGSNEMYFQAGMLSAYEAKFCQDPRFTGTLVYDEGIEYSAADKHLREGKEETIQFIQEAEGPWKIWCKLDLDEKTGRMRPPQNTTYVIFADVAKGTGASNTVFAVYRVDSKEQVAEMADPNLTPEEGARMLVAAALWFGGVYEPLIGWESNGDGQLLGKQVSRLEYPRVYYQEVQNQAGEPRTRTYGWNSSRTGKTIMLGSFRSALQREEMKCRSRAAIEECGRYIRYETGEIGLDELADVASGARASHGDRVIANAGARLLLDKQDFFDPSKFVASPEGSFLQRRRLVESAKAAAKKLREGW
jgi:hypothetical protein